MVWQHYGYGYGYGYWLIKGFKYGYWAFKGHRGRFLVFGGILPILRTIVSVSDTCRTIFILANIHIIKHFNCVKWALYGSYSLFKCSTAFSY